MSTLFEGVHLGVLDRTLPGGGPCVVTFSSINNHAEGFGEAFFAKHGVSAFHVVARWNHWWQPPEAGQAVAAVARALAALAPPRVLAYGSSMGGYGAALFARDLGAQAVLMLAPQWSADPARPPYERRWAAEARRVAFAAEDLGARIPREAVKYLAYDPAGADAAHAALFAAVPNTRLLRCLHGGHAVGHALQQAGVLTELVMAALGPGLTEEGWLRTWRGKRRASGRFWYELALHAGRRGRDARVLAWFEEAIRLRPGEAAFQVDFGYALLKHGQAARAAEAFRRAAEVAPEHSAPWRGLCVVRLRSGDAAGAAEAGLRALERRPDSTDLRRIAAQALIEAGEAGRAADLLLPAIAAEPDSPQNRKLFARALDRLAGAAAALEPRPAAAG